MIYLIDPFHYSAISFTPRDSPLNPDQGYDKYNNEAMQRRKRHWLRDASRNRSPLCQGHSRFIYL